MVELDILFSETTSKISVGRTHKKISCCVLCLLYTDFALFTVKNWKHFSYSFVLDGINLILRQIIRNSMKTLRIQCRITYYRFYTNVRIGPTLYPPTALLPYSSLSVPLLCFLWHDISKCNPSPTLAFMPFLIPLSFTPLSFFF